MDHQPPKKNEPHARFLRAGRWSEQYGCYAITKNPEIRLPLLAESEPAELILSSFDYLRKVGEIRLLAFCIMPDHYHVLMFLVGDLSLSDVMRSVGKYTARRLNRMFNRRGQFWQDGFYDHRCRDNDDILDRLTYIENNPVRAGLADKPEQWPFSSARPEQGGRLDRDWYMEVM